MFVCERVAGVNYVIADFTQQCGSPEWLRHLPLGTLPSYHHTNMTHAHMTISLIESVHMIHMMFMFVMNVIGIIALMIYPIGIPLFFFFLLRRNRNNLTDPRVLISLGFLYEAYNHNVWYFGMLHSHHA